MWIARRAWRLWTDKSAQDYFEYALIAAFLAMIAIATVPHLAHGVGSSLQHVATVLGAAGGNSEASLQLASAPGRARQAEYSPATTPVGYAPSARGGQYSIHWNTASRAVYVEYAGSHYVGDAPNATEAIAVARRWLERQ